MTQQENQIRQMNAAVIQKVESKYRNNPTDLNSFELEILKLSAARHVIQKKLDNYCSQYREYPG
jgi:hypothetical protein